MNPPLHMLSLQIDAEALIRFAQSQGLNHVHDEDLGYAIHAWLSACFGERAPKPFRLLNSHGPRLHLLAYSEHDGGILEGGAAIPREGLSPQRLAHARMPGQWRTGGNFDFELLACPITRRQRSEKDIYLRRLESLSTGDTPPGREGVYREWLAKQLEGAAELESCRLEGFHLVRMLRRTQATEASRTRSAPRLTRPRALLRGRLRIADAAEFHALLKRGIGRHRAFGYGMLLLSAPKGIS